MDYTFGERASLIGFIGEYDSHDTIILLKYFVGAFIIHEKPLYVIIRYFVPLLLYHTGNSLREPHKPMAHHIWLLLQDMGQSQASWNYTHRFLIPREPRLQKTLRCLHYLQSSFCLHKQTKQRLKANV